MKTHFHWKRISHLKDHSDWCTCQCCIVGCDCRDDWENVECHKPHCAPRINAPVVYLDDDDDLPF